MLNKMKAVVYIDIESNEGFFTLNGRELRSFQMGLNPMSLVSSPDSISLLDTVTNLLKEVTYSHENPTIVEEFNSTIVKWEKYAIDTVENLAEMGCSPTFAHESSVLSPATRYRESEPVFSVIITTGFFLENEHYPKFNLVAEIAKVDGGILLFDGAETNLISSELKDIVFDNDDGWDNIYKALRGSNIGHYLNIRDKSLDDFDFGDIMNSMILNNLAQQLSDSIRIGEFEKEFEGGGSEIPGCTIKVKLTPVV